MESASFYFRCAFFFVAELYKYHRHELFISPPLSFLLFLLLILCLMSSVARRGVALITSLAIAAGQCQSHSLSLSHSLSPRSLPRPDIFI